MVDKLKERIERLEQTINGTCDECGQKDQVLVRSCTQCKAEICPECIANNEHWHRKSATQPAPIEKEK